MGRDKIKNVAILTIFNNNNNYGGVLQAFALHKKVKELGYNADVLYYVNGKNPVYPSTKDQLKQYGIRDILGKVIEKLQAKMFNGKVSDILSAGLPCLINSEKNTYRQTAL